METDIQAGADGALRYVIPGRHVVDAGREVPATAIEERMGRGLAELHQLEAHWRRLAAIQPTARFVHAFEWQLAYLRNLESNPEAVHYVSFFVDGRAIAIFPLRRVRRSVGHIPHWLWELPSHPHLILGEPLIAPEWADADLFRRLLGVLERRSRLPWDALHLPNLLEDAQAIRLLARTPLPRTHLEQIGYSMYFDCGDLERALVNCSGAFKRNLRRQGRKLEQRGTVSLCLARQGDELEAAFADFLRLEASGWKGRGGKGSAIDLHAHLRGFYGELSERFAAHGGSLIALLKLDGVAIAAQFCLRVGDILYVLKIAYDQNWQAEAPGNQLLYRLLDYCCGEPGLRQLSLVTAPDWACGRWNPERLAVWEAYLFRASPRGLGGLAMRRFKRRLEAPTRDLWARTRDALGWPPAEALRAVDRCGPGR